MNNEDVERNILALYGEQKWKEICSLNYTFNEVEKCRLFWVLPTINDLYWINEIVKKHKLRGLISVGCGCGLLEWLFQKYSNTDVIGIELDRSWWCSKYAPPIFLDNVIFIDENATKDFCVSDEYALLFCYFNNASAFCSYINNYEGNLVLVIGPGEKEGRWTDPLPFDKKFEKLGWKLIDKTELGRSKDYVAAYSR